MSVTVQMESDPALSLVMCNDEPCCKLAEGRAR